MLKLPWLVDSAELNEFLTAPPPQSAVVVTRPYGSAPAVSLGRAVGAALTGETQSISALVGYFGHASTMARRTDDDTGDTEELENDPATIILREGNERLAARVASTSAPARFRLLFGQLSPNATVARLALRTWYWLCRWHAAPDTQGIAGAYVEALFAEASRLQGTPDAFRSIAGRFLTPDTGRDSEVGPLPLFYSQKCAPSYPSRRPATDDDNAKFLECCGWWTSVPTSQRDRADRLTAAELVLFLLTHAGEVRVAPPRSVVKDLKDHGIFHAKLYVVERGTPQDDPRTVVIAGSGNWSTSAFSGEDGVRSNTELSTIHTVTGHAWHSPDGDDIASRLVASAAHLFESGHSLATWDIGVTQEAAEAAIPSAKLAWRWIDWQHQAPSEAPPPAIDPVKRQAIARIFRHMVGTILGVSADDAAALALGKRGQNFAGQKPAPYQIEGALRLTSLLRQAAPLSKGSGTATPTGGSSQSRGVFLTDEAGLGKTLIGQLVVHQLIVEKLTARLAPGSPPLRVTFIAPKQLAGDAPEIGTESRGWQRHQAAIRTEVEKTLSPVLAERGLSAKSWIDENLLTRVVSISSLSRKAFDEQDNLVASVANEMLHVARSEIVLVDESHNLRNSSAKKSKIIRWLLSLPVPGERWPIRVAGRTLSGVGDLYQRKILLLSATPYNNALTDLITQFGHFASFQDWSDVAASDGVRDTAQGALLPKVAPSVTEWLETWCDPARSAQHMDAMEFMLSVLTARPGSTSTQRTAFFSSSRTMDQDPLAKEMVLAGQRKPKQIRDTGPAFNWGPGYEEAAHIFPPIQKFLEPDKSGARPDGSEAAEAATAQAAINRLDTLLAGVFVQRSRTRVLSSMGADERQRMFREPDRPRMPLALNVWSNDTSAEIAFEADVLSQLFRMLDSVRENGVVAVEDAGALHLFGYRLKALADSLGDDGTDSQGARNSFGFILVGLVKRLQSSPYAFLRTLLSGVFRSSVRWIAVVQRILRDSGAATADARKRLEAAAGAVSATVDLIGSLSPGNQAALAGLLGGEWAPNDFRCIGRLIGGGSPQSDGPTVAAEVKAQQALFDLILKGDVDPDRSKWQRALVEDLERGGAGKLYADARVALCWAFGQPVMLGATRPLYEQLFPAADLIAALGQARTLADVRERLRSQQPPHLGPMLDEWVATRLKNDPRVARLLGWLAIQALARDADWREAGCSLVDMLPGGAKTLVFSEYTDTLDYVTTLLQALSIVAAGARDSEANPAFVAPLVGAMREAANTLTDESKRVTRVSRTERHAPGAPVSPPAPIRFSPPVDLDWLESKLGAQVAGEMIQPTARATLMRALASMRELAGICTGAGGRSLGFGDGTTPAPLLAHAGLEADELGMPMETDVVIEDDAVLDAFSPYYQIAPADRLEPESGVKSAAALKLAAARPIHALFATQVLAEGVNLQECAVVVHYDLPWNPTSLVQRNGRIDRRIAQVYEDPSQLADFLMRQGIQAADAPRFVAPRQVYHLTLVPPEPRSATQAEAPTRADKLSLSVRSTLLTKLNSIRRLFGLSSWPVVLDNVDARKVLSGELDFETPGIRRREELFSQLSELAVEALPIRTGQRPEAEIRAPGTLLCAVHESVRDKLLGDLEPSAPGVCERATVGLGIWEWSPWDGNLKTARSGVEWRDRSAITAWALRADHHLLAWKMGQAGKPLRIVPEWRRFMECVDAAGHREYEQHASTALRDADEAESATALAPTSMAEEWLSRFVAHFLEETAGFQFDWSGDFQLPPSALDVEGNLVGAARLLKLAPRGVRGGWADQLQLDAAVPTLAPDADAWNLLATFPSDQEDEE